MVVALAIARYGVNFPYWDEWRTPGFLWMFRYYEGGIDFADFFELHNESRKVFPRAVFFALEAVTGTWDPKAAMWGSFGLAIATALALGSLTRRTLARPVLRRGCSLAIALLAFSPVQYENQLWGIQLCTYLSAAAMVGAVVLTRQAIAFPVRFWGCAALCTVAVFSFANGLLSWGVVAIALFSEAMPRRELLHQRWRWVLAWGAIALAEAIAYFRDYAKPDGHPALSESLGMPLKTLHYFLVFLGNPFGDRNVQTATHVGVFVMVAGAGLTAFWIARGWRDGKLWVRAAPWLALGSYSAASGAIAAAGRVSFGVDQALSSRYVTFSWFALLAIAQLAALVWETVPSLRKGWSWRGPVYMLLGIGLVLHLETAREALMEEAVPNYRDRLTGQACATLWPVAPAESCIERLVFPQPSFWAEFIFPAIDPQGLLATPAVRDPDPSQLAAESSERAGRMDRLAQLADDRYRVAGWAALPDRGEPADAVLVSYRQGDGRERAFALAWDRFEREGARPPFPFPCRQDCNLGWEVHFDRDRLPSGPVELRAWAYDAAARRTYPLSGRYRVD